MNTTQPGKVDRHPAETTLLVTVIIPAFNEEQGIGQTLETLLGARDERFTVFVVDDGSSDNTAEIVSKYPKATLFQHNHNYGYGAALKTGISKAHTEYVAFYDADGQHNTEDLIRLFDHKEDAEMVVGSRGHCVLLDLRRGPGKIVLHLLANFLTGTHIPDLNSGLRVVHRKTLLRYLHLLPNGFSASTTMTMTFLSRNYAVKYLPITANKRVGKSSVKQFRDGYRTITLILRMVILFNPMRFFGFFSLFFFLTGTFYGAYKLLQVGVGLSTGALLLLLTSIIGFVFGLLCDQMSSLRMERFETNDPDERLKRPP